MIEHVGIQNGDMVSLVKVVNHNTMSLNNRISNNRKLGDVRMKHIAEGFEYLEKKSRVNSKNLSRLAFCVIGCEVFLFLHERQLHKIEKRLKKLEEQVDKCIESKEEDDFDFLK